MSCRIIHKKEGTTYVIMRKKSQLLNQDVLLHGMFAIP
jgi:hypothetical protein